MIIPGSISTYIEHLARSASGKPHKFVVGSNIAWDAGDGVCFDRFPALCTSLMPVNDIVFPLHHQLCSRCLSFKISSTHHPVPAIPPDPFSRAPCVVTVISPLDPQLMISIIHPYHLHSTLNHSVSVVLSGKVLASQPSTCPNGDHKICVDTQEHAWMAYGRCPPFSPKAR